MATALTRASLLREHRGPHYVEEWILLKDVAFTLQAISTQCIAFPTKVLPTTSASFTCALSPSLAQIVSQVIETGLLYKRISEFISEDDPSGGLVKQSLRANFVEEITGYLNKVSVIEGQIKDPINITSDSMGDAKVTLKRVLLWTREDVLRLRMMNYLIDRIGPTQGGALVNVIYDLSNHGDPFIQQFAIRMLTEISLPFYEMMAGWIYEGELVDPHAEFLVAPADASATTRSSTARRMARPRTGDSSEDAWKGKYILVETMIPRWISNKLAEKIFLIGKSLNFIRYSCADADFVSNHRKLNFKVLTYGDTSSLERSIDEAYSLTAQHLRHLMLTKFHLLDHLAALKKYILLNAGDFVSVLMELLGESLEHPASTLHRHNLTSSLGDAIQTSNAQHEPEYILKHLDARMLEGTRGTVGWEVFTLEYRVGKPVDVVITEQSARQYLKVFNFLWRLKRVEFALATAWRRQMTAERGMLNHVDSVTRDWQSVRGTSSEMIHFVCQLQYYILYEVIEDSWLTLEKELLSSATGLDGMIAAHTKYVRDIIDKALLGSQQKSDNKHEREEDCLSLLHDILKIMLAYKDQTDQLYSYTLTQFAKVQSFVGKRHGYDSTRDEAQRDSVLGDHDNLKAIRARLSKLAAEFKESTSYLLAALAYQKSETMRFLAVRLNYNEFYTIPRPRKHRSSKDRDKEREKEEEREQPRETRETLTRT